MTQQTLLSFNDVSFSYKQSSSDCFRALSNINVDFVQGTSTAIIGESGSGKTTFARLALGLFREYTGTIAFYNRSILDWISDRESELQFRKKIQYVFQNPDRALSPKMSMKMLFYEVLDTHFPNLTLEEKKRKITKSLEDVCLDNEYLEKYSFQLSGGQKQRFVLARALLMEPQLLILDEPLASLDASLRLSITELLQNIQQKYHTTYIYITHDIANVEKIADSVLIFYKGKLIEKGKTSEIYSHATHNYTQTLLRSTLKDNNY